MDNKKVMPTHENSLLAFICSEEEKKNAYDCLFKQFFI